MPDFGAKPYIFWCRPSFSSIVMPYRAPFLCHIVNTYSANLGGGGGCHCYSRIHSDYLSVDDVAKFLLGYCKTSIFSGCCLNLLAWLCLWPFEKGSGGSQLCSWRMGSRIVCLEGARNLCSEDFSRPSTGNIAQNEGHEDATKKSRTMCVQTR